MLPEPRNGCRTVLQGAITVEVDDQVIALETGGTPWPFLVMLNHAYAENPHQEPARFSLAVFEPGVGAVAAPPEARHGAGRGVPARHGPSTAPGSTMRCSRCGPITAARRHAAGGRRPGARPRRRGQRGAAATGRSGCPPASNFASTPSNQLPHIAAWREAYGAFGAKPQRTRNSVEALDPSRAEGALPRVNRLTDLYNAVSVLHQLPVGGRTCRGIAVRHS